MSDEMSRYEEERLELEREKVRLLRKIRKDMKHQRNLENIHNIVDTLEIDRDDIDAAVSFIGEHLEKRREDEG